MLTPHQEATYSCTLAGPSLGLEVPQPVGRSQLIASTASSQLFCLFTQWKRTGTSAELASCTHLSAELLSVSMCLQVKTQFEQTGACTYLLKAPKGTAHKLRSTPEVLSFAVFYGTIDSKVCFVAAFETQCSVFTCTCTCQRTTCLVTLSCAGAGSGAPPEPGEAGGSDMDLEHGHDAVHLPQLSQAG